MTTTQKPGAGELSWDNLELPEVRPRSSSPLEVDWEKPENRSPPRDPFRDVKVESEQRPGAQGWETAEVAAPQKNPQALPGGVFPERGRLRKRSHRRPQPEPGHPIPVAFKVAAWVVAMMLVASLAYALVENRAAENSPPLPRPQPPEADSTQEAPAPPPLELGAVTPALPGAPALSVADVTVAEGNAGEVSLEFKIKLPSALPGEARVDYATVNATALSESDYRPAKGTLVFKPGETEKNVKVALIPDTIPEPDETFSLSFSRAQGISPPPANATAKITNDDAAGAPVISISDVRVKEGGPAKFTLTITPPMPGPGSIVYATANGSAVAPGDYGPGTGTISFKGRESKAELSVFTTVDPAPEPDETFVVNLSGPVGMQLGDAQAVGTITEKDVASPPAPGPGLSVNDVTAAEGNSITEFVFKVSLSAPSSQEVSVSYATAPGGPASGAEGTDWAPASGKLVFSPGETFKLVKVQIFGDTSAEPDKTFLLRLSGEKGSPVSDREGLGTIVNDD